MSSVNAEHLHTQLTHDIQSTDNIHDTSTDNNTQSTDIQTDNIDDTCAASADDIDISYEHLWETATEERRHLKSDDDLIEQQSPPPTVITPTRLFKRRWLMVFLFACYSMSNAYQWIHLNIIFDKVHYSLLICLT